MLKSSSVALLWSRLDRVGDKLHTALAGTEHLQKLLKDALAHLALQ